LKFILLFIITIFSGCGFVGKPPPPLNSCKKESEDVYICETSYNSSELDSEVNAHKQTKLKMYNILSQNLSKDIPANEEDIRNILNLVQDDLLFQELNHFWNGEIYNLKAKIKIGDTKIISLLDEKKNERIRHKINELFFNLSKDYKENYEKLIGLFKEEAFVEMTDENKITIKFFLKKLST
jgi:hypothetical protein